MPIRLNIFAIKNLPMREHVIVAFTPTMTVAGAVAASELGLMARG